MLLHAPTWAPFLLPHDSLSFFSLDEGDGGLDDGVVAPLAVPHVALADAVERVTRRYVPLRRLCSAAKPQTHITFRAAGRFDGFISLVLQSRGPRNLVHAVHQLGPTAVTEKRDQLFNQPRSHHAGKPGNYLQCSSFKKNSSTPPLSLSPSIFFQLLRPSLSPPSAPRNLSPSLPPPPLLTETLLKLDPPPAASNQARSSDASGRSGGLCTIDDELRVPSDRPLKSPSCCGCGGVHGRAT